MLKLQNINKVYNTSGGSVTANKNISYEFPQNGFVFILGKSGCGKTTLLNIIAGLIEQDEGRILVDDIEINKNSNLDEYRNLNIGIIFQQYNLIDNLNVYDNLNIAFELQDRELGSSKQQLISDILEKVDIKGYEKRKISELSGGEKQRVAIARALLKEPDVILADEPTGNLDAGTGEKVLELLSEIAKEKLIIMVSHDGQAAEHYGDLIINMKDGEFTTIETATCKHPYEFELEAEGKITSYHVNNMREMLSLIKDNINLGKTDINIKNIRNIKAPKENTQSANQTEACKNSKAKVKNLSEKYVTGLAFKFMQKRRIRLFMTMIIFTLSFVMMYFAMYISFYNKKEIAVKYLNQTKPTIIQQYINKEFEDTYGNYITQTLSNGKYVYDKIQKLTDKIECVKAVKNKAILKTSDEYGENAFFETTIFYPTSEHTILSLETGNMPVTENDILVSDYLADKLGLEVGSEITDLSMIYSVCGIIDTDYEEKELVKRLDSGNIGPELQYKCENEYFVCYASEKSYEKEKQNIEILFVQAGNIMQNRLNTIIKGIATYASGKSVKDEDILVGRRPNAANEILISETIAKEYNITSDDLSKVRNCRNLYDKQYNYVYSNYINMYDYFENGFVVTGIVKDNDGEAVAYYVIPELFEKIKSDYYSYYYPEYFIFAGKTNYKELYTYAIENEVILQEPGLDQINEFDSSVNKIKPVLYMIFGIIFIINFFTIAIFISSSIGENSKNIGILRSIGVPMRKCSHIFNFEFMLLFIVSVIIGIVAINVIINKGNALYMKNLSDTQFDIIILGKIMLLIAILLEFLMGMISSKLPILELKKKEISELMQ